MVKTIIFAIIFFIRLHHYHGEDYCFCHYFLGFTITMVKTIVFAIIFIIIILF